MSLNFQWNIQSKKINLILQPLQQDDTGSYYKFSMFYGHPHHPPSTLLIPHMKLISSIITIHYTIHYSHSSLKIKIFHKSFPPQSGHLTHRTAFMDLGMLNGFSVIVF